MKAVIRAASSSVRGEVGQRVVVIGSSSPSTAVSSSGLTGRSSNHRPEVLACIEIGSFRFRQFNAEVGQARLRVKPGNDTGGMPETVAQCGLRLPLLF